MRFTILAVLVVICAGTWWIAKAQNRTRVRDAVISVKYPASEWEHGWKTSRVIATRYNNEVVGYNIGFKFPLNGDDCDRAELSDFMRLHDGNVYSGGGSFGAEMFVVFKDVKDKEAANVKLKAILPALSQLIKDLGNGVKVDIPQPKNAKKWPDTEPPDKSDSYWEFNSSSLNVNGTQYKKAEVSPGKWQWVVNEKAMRDMAERDNHRRELFAALSSRVLTDAEMKEVQSYGSNLNLEWNVPYYPEQKAQELSNALQMQQILVQRQSLRSSP